jgi:hypothetical protein
MAFYSGATHNSDCLYLMLTIGTPVFQLSALVTTAHHTKDVSSALATNTGGLLEPSEQRAIRLFQDSSLSQKLVPVKELTLTPGLSVRRIDLLLRLPYVFCTLVGKRPRRQSTFRASATTIFSLPAIRLSSFLILDAPLPPVLFFADNLRISSPICANSSRSRSIAFAVDWSMSSTIRRKVFGARVQAVLSTNQSMGMRLVDKEREPPLLRSSSKTKLEPFLSNSQHASCPGRERRSQKSTIAASVHA